MFKGSSIEFDECISPSTQYIVHIVNANRALCLKLQPEDNTYIFFCCFHFIHLYFDETHRFILSLMCNNKHNLFIFHFFIYYALPHQWCGAWCFNQFTKTIDRTSFPPSFSKNSNGDQLRHCTFMRSIFYFVVDVIPLFINETST